MNSCDFLNSLLINPPPTLPAAVSEGLVTLHAVELNGRRLQSLLAEIGFPMNGFQISRCFCSKLTITIPWGRLYDRSSVIAIQQLDVEVSAESEDDPDNEHFLEMLNAGLQMRIEFAKIKFPGRTVRLEGLFLAPCISYSTEKCKVSYVERPVEAIQYESGMIRLSRLITIAKVNWCDDHSFSLEIRVDTHYQDDTDKYSDSIFDYLYDDIYLKQPISRSLHFSSTDDVFLNYDILKYFLITDFSFSAQTVRLIEDEKTFQISNLFMSKAAIIDVTFDSLSCPHIISCGRGHLTFENKGWKRFDLKDFYVSSNELKSLYEFVSSHPLTFHISSLTISGGQPETAEAHPLLSSSVLTTVPLTLPELKHLLSFKLKEVISPLLPSSLSIVQCDRVLLSSERPEEELLGLSNDDAGHSTKPVENMGIADFMLGG